MNESDSPNNENGKTDEWKSWPPEDFLSNLTHELRIPLIAISAYAELLSDETRKEFHPKALENISPYINRFLSPDTIVPGVANPQAWNRYSYVLNNPLRYTDPTGHYCVGDDEDCADEGGYGPAPNPNPNPAPAPAPGGGNPHDDDEYDPNPNGVTLDEPTYGDGLIGPPEDPNGTVTPYVENSPWIVVNWYGLANFTQDIATTVSGIGAGAEFVFIGYGCAVGGIYGCAGAVALANFVWVGTGLNGVEQGLGFVSLVSTGIGDYQDDGAFGEATHTSLATFGAGFIITDPILDLVVDGYASGYNHGYFCGVDTIISCIGNP